MARILVVDDEKKVRQSVRVVLEGADHVVMEAVNGKQAEALLAQNRFDLVITDLIMPDKTGIELIMELNINYSEMKIIAMTGGGLDVYQNVKRESSAFFDTDDFLEKPFKLARLLQSVEDCLSGKTKRR